MRAKKAPAKRSVEKQEGPTKTAKPHRDKQADGVADALTALTHTVAEQHQTDRQQEAREDRGKRYREYATIALLVLTTAGLFVQAVVFYRQLGEMQKVYAPIAEQAKATRESYVSVQRAFVSDVRFALIPKAIKDGKPGYWEPKVTIQNSGATPTKALEYAIAYVPAPKQAGDPGILIDSPPGFVTPTSGKLTVGPHARAELALQLLTFQPDPPDTNSQTEWFSSKGVLTGVVRYRDQFLDSDLHVTKFCFVIWLTTEARIYPLLCPHWNCSDDDCEAEEEEQRAARVKSPPPAPKP